MNVRKDSDESQGQKENDLTEEQSNITPAKELPDPINNPIEEEGDINLSSNEPIIETKLVAEEP